MKLTIKPLVIELFNEALMRFVNYFFEQFMNSLLYTDPYNDPQKDEFERLKRIKTMNKDPNEAFLKDLKQITEIMDMDIRISDFSINIPDRPLSKAYLSMKV